MKRISKIVTAYKVKCRELTKNKKELMTSYVNEYARIYNMASGLVPSLPESHLINNNSKLYTKWIKKGQKELLKSDILSATQIQSALNQAIANYTVSHTVNKMNKPNIIKFANSEYEIIKINDMAYGIRLKPLQIIVPLDIGNGEWIKEHLDKGIQMGYEKKERDKTRIPLTNGKKSKKIKAGLGEIVYNLHDNTFSIPNEIECKPGISWNDVQTVIGIDLGKNNTAVMCAIDVNSVSQKNISSILYKEVSLKTIPAKILKFKYIRGFENNHKLKHLRTAENKRRKHRKPVGYRRINLTNSTNHRVSHEIELFASKFPNSIVVFEKNLANLRNPTWSPSDVRAKSEYKLKEHGISTLDVHSGYTSMICHRCGSFGKRKKGSVHFSCPACGLGQKIDNSHKVIFDGLYNADGNASVNIALRGLYVLTRPKKEKETVGYTNGDVASPKNNYVNSCNTNPNENTRKESRATCDSALDGYLKGDRTRKTESRGSIPLGIECEAKSVATLEDGNPMAGSHANEPVALQSDFLADIKENIIFQQDQNLNEKPATVR